MHKQKAVDYNYIILLNILTEIYKMHRYIKWHKMNKRNKKIKNLARQHFFEAMPFFNAKFFMILFHKKKVHSSLFHNFCGLFYVTYNEIDFI